MLAEVQYLAEPALPDRAVYACFHAVTGGDSHCAVQTSLEDIVDAVETPDASDAQRLGPAAKQQWLQREPDERSRRLSLTLGQAMSACLSPLEGEMLTGAYGLGSEPPLGVCGVGNAPGMHAGSQGQHMRMHLLFVALLGKA